MKILLISLLILVSNDSIDLSPQSVYEYCVEQDIQHPEIVTAQAIQESGWFKCTHCSLNKNNIFKVPDNYFENFPDRLQKRIEETEQQKKVPVIRLRTIINIAAAPVIFIFVIYGITKLNDSTTSADQLLSEISTEDLVDFLVESEMSTDEFLESLDMSIIASTEDPISDEFIPSDPLDEDTIDELLDEYEIEMQYL